MPSMRGGESVGSAYVRIYGDGRSMPGDIRKALKDSEPSVRQGGREMGHTLGEETNKGFNEQFGDDFWKDLDASLKRAIERIDLSDQFFDKSIRWKKFKKDVRKNFEGEFGEAAHLAMLRIEREFRDTGDLDVLHRRMAQIGKLVRQEQEKILKAEEKQTIARLNLFRKAVREVEEEINRFEKGEGDRDRGRLEHLMKTLRNIAPNLDLAGEELHEFNTHMDLFHRRLDRASPKVAEFDHRIRRLADAFGKMTGRGSRNNFLNLFGSIIRGLTLTARAIPAVIGWVARLQRAWTSAADAGEGFFSVFKEGIVASLKVAGKGAAGIVAVAGIIATVIAALGPIAAIISGIAGIFTALAASIGYALVGALGAIMPLLIPFAVILGGVVATVIELKNANGALKESLDDVKESASNMFDLFKENAFKNLDEQVRRVNQFLIEQPGLFEAAGKGWNRFAQNMTKALTSPAMKAFTDRFALFLPSAMSRLGDIFGNLTEGAAGIFRAAIPLANRFLGWLDKITQRFSDWANSPEGQKEIQDFLEEAGDSAESLWGFLKKAWDWLSKILAGGKDTGDNLLIKMGDKFESWSQWLDDNPDALKDWFAHAEETAGDIGETLDKLIEVMDRLDNPKSRKAAHGLFEGLSFSLDVILFEIGMVEKIGSAVWYVMGGKWVGDLFRGIYDAWGKFRDYLRPKIIALGENIWGALVSVKDWLIGKLSGWWQSIIGSLTKGGGGGGMNLQFIDTRSLTKQLDKVRTWFAELPGKIKGAVSKIPGMVQGIFNRLPGPVQGVINKVVGFFRALPGRIRSGIASLVGQVQGVFNRIPGLATTVVNKVVGFFRALPGKIGQALSTLGSQAQARFNAIVTAAQSIPGKIVAFFQGLGGRIVSAIGSININWPDPPGWLSKYTASGGVFAGAQARIIGEAGPEAVVPLNRPLHLVDPSVRWLSAVAQGKAPEPMAAGGVSTPKTIDASNWTIVSPSADPATVAVEVLNHLAAASY